jgi:Rieske Fe-S protein
VQATNVPILDRFAMHTKQAPYRTYVIGARVRRGAVPAGLYWDTLDAYHYVRLLDADGAGEWDVLIVGGEDHKTGQSDDENAAFDRLEAWTRARFPVEAVEHRWSGQVLEPVDLVAFIGRDPEYRHVWLVTGDSGNGMTHGTIAGLLLPALIAGQEHPWEALYDPSRVTLKAAPDWLKENANVAAQYAEYVAPGDVDAVAEVPAGEGRVLRRGAQPLAVYRGEDGAVTVRSAVCPHLYCIVDWNAAEKSWDCPCHGSRFAPDGTVLNGPSRAPLAPVEGPLPGEEAAPRPE